MPRWIRRGADESEDGGYQVGSALYGDEVETRRAFLSSERKGCTSMRLSLGAQPEWDWLQCPVEWDPREIVNHAIVLQLCLFPE